jgi:CRISPR-associated protein Cas1
MAARDDRRVLYLNTQGARVGCSEGVLQVREKEKLTDEVRLLDVAHVAVFGNVQVSTQAIQRMLDADVPISWLTTGGWFYGITRGHGLPNVLSRIAQFRAAADPVRCLALAREFVRGKIHNHRVFFMRNHASPPERVKNRLGVAREDARTAESLAELLGIEGAAAAEYFAEFAGFLRASPAPDELDAPLPESGAAACTGDSDWVRFDFRTRNRRPPADPVNAMLSLAYSLLAKECTLAAIAVGLDPYVGFYHQPRHGRPALALDVMEEFRPLIAESVVITAINNRMIGPGDFVRAGNAVNFSAPGRKQFIVAFEQRMNALITHPVFEYKVSYRRALELQMRILARVLTGELESYIPFMTR